MNNMVSYRNTKKMKLFKKTNNVFESKCIIMKKTPIDISQIFSI